MKLFGYLIIETAKSDDSVPVSRDPETGALILLDAAYSLHDNHSEEFYDRAISIIASLVKAYGHPCGSWDDTSIDGLQWTIV